MTITLASCTGWPARADIDPVLTLHYQDLQPRLSEMGYPPLDIPAWIEDFRQHADEHLPPHGRTWIARDGAGRAVGWGTLRRVRPDAGEMKRLFVRPEVSGRGLARRLVQARIDDAREMGWRHLLADTVRTNVEMQTLYLSFGFRFIDPYPESGTVRADPQATANLKFVQLDL
jgi:GNAT superfamily N-acetyltransferase